MQPVKMYTTAVCPYCTRAKQILKSKGVEQIEEIRIDTDPGPQPHDGNHRPPHGAADLHRHTHVGGHDDLVALDGRGG
jgi:glutaredoxin 3